MAMSVGLFKERELIEGVLCWVLGVGLESSLKQEEVFKLGAQ